MKVAGDVGMDKADVAEKLDNGTDIDAVNAEVERAYRMGVTGVPCFIFAQKQGLMGAQPAEVLADAIGKLAA
ncbi:MAG: DsbA family protein [Aestuariivirga sp.]|nr:DsbA family protein [Aestuariivirga sp.]